MKDIKTKDALIEFVSTDFITGEGTNNLQILISTYFGESFSFWLERKEIKALIKELNKFIDE